MKMLHGTHVFEDRADAGRQLAARLASYRDQSPLIIALPRGGVAVGYEIARALDAPLDVLVARKLGAPGREELGIGAIAPGGVRIVDDFGVRYLGITSEKIEEIVARETVEMERRLKLYRGDRPLPDVAGRTVILVDDGLATGVTARAAIEALRRMGAGRIVLAVPVCAPETASAMRARVDDLICLMAPEEFYAVGLWYQDFAQMTDREVTQLLVKARTDCERREGV